MDIFNEGNEIYGGQIVKQMEEEVKEPEQ